MTTKVCSKCGEEKPLSDFPVRKDRPCGVRSYCKKCDYDYTKRLRKANPEKLRDDARKWKQDRRKNNPEALKREKRKSDLKIKYGLTLEQFDAMWHSQDGKCAICSTELSFGTHGHAVDHNHDTGEVRGLICQSCNLGLGKFKDNPEFLLSAYKYLIERGHYARK